MVPDTVSIRPHEKEKVHYSADFQTGRPDMRLFPRYVWQQMMHNALTELPLGFYEYGDPQGMEELRREISAWLFRSRGINAETKDIFITGGATGALHLTACLLEHGGKIAMEDPCNRGVLDTFLQAGCRIEPVPADEQGMDISCLSGKDVKMVYLTPSHQFPLGGILPAAHRVEAVRYAEAKDAYLIEDDYDSEFRYTGEPVSPLYGHGAAASDLCRDVQQGTVSGAPDRVCDLAPQTAGILAETPDAYRCAKCTIRAGGTGGISTSKKI
ncbi:PLP-dependent aminotransferase family protein [Pectinatus frisingensis]